MARIDGADPAAARRNAAHTGTDSFALPFEADRQEIGNNSPAPERLTPGYFIYNFGSPDAPRSYGPASRAGNQWRG